MLVVETFYFEFVDKNGTRLQTVCQFFRYKNLAANINIVKACSVKYHAFNTTYSIALRLFYDILWLPSNRIGYCVRIINVEIIYDALNL